MRFFLEGGQVLELFEAGTAPGSPYIDIDNFTFKGFYRILQTGDGGVACQNMIVFVGDTAILKAQVFFNARFEYVQKRTVGELCPISFV